MSLFSNKFRKKWRICKSLLSFSQAFQNTNRENYGYYKNFAKNSSLVTSFCLVISLSVNAIAADTTKPVLTQVTAIPVKTNDTTPSYTFKSSEAGTLVFWSNCTSTNRTVIAGNNTITFSQLAAGTYNCSLSVQDATGNVSATLSIPSFTIETAKPVLTQVSAVPIAINDTTPSYTFSSTKAGSIIYSGACKSKLVSAIKGNNLVTFNTLLEGTYSNCTIKVKDSIGNVSSVLAIPTFTIDTSKPALAMVTEVPSPTADSTPSYTFKSTEAGTIIYGGACKSSLTKVIIGNNTVTFNSLADGTYSNCTIKVKDAAGNVSAVKAVTTFTINTADVTKPVLTLVANVKNPTNDPTPSYVFNSTEAGTIIYAGACTSVQKTAVKGNNTLIFNELNEGTYSGCTIKVKDVVGNISQVLTVNIFTIDLTKPILTQVTPVPTIPIGSTPSYTFSTTEAGSISYGGSCISFSNTAYLGANTVTFKELIDGRYSNCTIKVVDAAGNEALALLVNTFTIRRYTKLDENGSPLPANASSWSCVKDKQTGLIWEEKTNNGGLRDKHWTYSWFNTDSKTNGGFAGYQDYGDNCFVSSRCDTQKYVEDVNISFLCGTSNWRMPKKDELVSLLTCKYPSCSKNYPLDNVNPTYFPDTTSLYWTATTYDSNSAWARLIVFMNGQLEKDNKNNLFSVRLVHD